MTEPAIRLGVLTAAGQGMVGAAAQVGGKATFQGFAGGAERGADAGAGAGGQLGAPGQADGANNFGVHATGEDAVHIFRSVGKEELVTRGRAGGMQLGGGEDALAQQLFAQQGVFFLGKAVAGWEGQGIAGSVENF